MRLLSAATRALVDLEQHIARLLRDMPGEDKLAFCSAVYAEEDKVAGAMAVSNKKMNRAIWLMLVSFFVGIHLVTSSASSIALSVSDSVTILIFCVLLLAFAIWALVAFLNLLRSIGDALDDLVEEMLKVQNLGTRTSFSTTRTASRIASAPQRGAQARVGAHHGSGDVGDHVQASGRWYCRQRLCSLGTRALV